MTLKPMTLNRRMLLQWSALGFTLAACSRKPSPPVALEPASPAPSPSPAPEPSVIEGLPNPTRGDVRLVVISDLNGSYGSTTYDEEVKQAIALIPDWNPDIVIGGGDMVAGQSKELSKERVEAMWAGFDQVIAKPLRDSNLPFGFTVGNHDASRAVGVNGLIYQQERDLAATYWNAPEHTPNLQFIDRANFPFYYTFEQNGVFFLVWDASSGLKFPPNELAWIEQSLASDRAQAARLRIVVGHLPLYAVAKDRDRIGEVLGGADELHTLLETYGVHTYISGHHHAYYPGHLGKLEFLHAGAMGSGPRQLLRNEQNPRKTLTVVDINVTDGTTTYTTYDMQAKVIVSMEELPRAIASHNGLVIRRDLEWAELTPDEQSACLQKIEAARCQTT